MNISRSVVCSFVAGLAIAAPAFAQWTEEHQVYQIHRIGLFGPANTGGTGLQTAAVSSINNSGWVTGSSDRYLADDSSNGRDVWLFDGEGTHQIGLTGGAYTSAAGFQYATLLGLNQAGQVAGTSDLLNALGARIGDMSWVYNGTSTIEMGFSGGVYTSESGRQLSVLVAFNNAGQAGGYSSRYGAGGVSLGEDAWIWTGTTLRQVGFTSAAYTGVSQVRQSRVTALNDSGKAIGFSSRYYAGSDTYYGQDAWIVTGQITQRIGFIGAGYETDAGFRYSSAYRLNSAGDAAGFSERYLGGTSLGQDSWLFDGANTRMVGLFGSVYTCANNERSSVISYLNEAGQVAGHSSRYGAIDASGQDAWLSDGTTTRQIGLTGGAYTTSLGLQHSETTILTPAGLVAGLSWRFTSPDIPNGADAWVFNGTTTRQVGLTGGVYTGSNGRQDSQTRVLNDGARACGVSQRFTGVDTDNGRNTWYWTGSATRLIGLTDTIHTGTGGIQRGDIHRQNAQGQTAGYSYRYDSSGTERGRDAWYYDPATNTTTPIIGAVRMGDSFAYSRVDVLTDDGFAIGTYLVFAGPLDLGQQRAFIFRPDHGMTDLGTLVSGGLSESGWTTLSSPRLTCDSGTIAGYGFFNGQTTGSSAFAMTIPDCPACAADYDRDGGVTGGDIGAFFADFETGDSCADVDHDGGVTGGDLGAFFTLYEAGGC